jgi:hypothetical protein
MLPLKLNVLIKFLNHLLHHLNFNLKYLLWFKKVFLAIGASGFFTSQIKTDLSLYKAPNFYLLLSYVRATTSANTAYSSGFYNYVIPFSTL